MARGAGGRGPRERIPRGARWDRGSGLGGELLDLGRELVDLGGELLDVLLALGLGRRLALRLVGLVEATLLCQRGLRLVLHRLDGLRGGDLNVVLVVHAVDLDAFSDPARYATLRCFCSSITRVPPDELYQLPQATSALLFIWGRALPWRSYLVQNPQVGYCVIAGEPADTDYQDHCATEPRGGALDGDSGWRLVVRTPIRAVHGGAALHVYERVQIQMGQTSLRPPVAVDSSAM